MPRYDTFKFFTPKDGGQYPVKILSVSYDADAKYGPQVELELEISDPETSETMKFTQWVQTQISDRYPLFAQLIDLTYGQHQEAGDFEADDMIGMEGVATIVLVPGKGDKANQQYARVSSIVPKAQGVAKK